VNARWVAQMLVGTEADWAGLIRRYGSMIIVEVVPATSRSRAAADSERRSPWHGLRTFRTCRPGRYAYADAPEAGQESEARQWFVRGEADHQRRCTNESTVRYFDHYDEDDRGEPVVS
jgi:hypothetical protein